MPCPSCASGAGCVGKPEDDLYYDDNSGEGDARLFYCETCWLAEPIDSCQDRETQLRIREERRKVAIEDGIDEEGRSVKGKYAPNVKLQEAAKPDIERQKLIVASSQGFHSRLRALEKGREERDSDGASDEEDMAIYGDLFSAEGLHEAADASKREDVTVVAIEEGVAAKEPSMGAKLFDTFLGGTRFDSSGRRLLEQRPFAKGARPRAFLRRSSLRQKLPQAFLSYQKLSSDGHSAQELKALGWDPRGHMVDQVKTRAEWQKESREAEKVRVGKYDQQERCVTSVGPASMLGVPNPRGKKRAREDKQADGAAKRQKCGVSTGIVKRAVARVRFAVDA